VRERRCTDERIGVVRRKVHELGDMTAHGRETFESTLRETARAHLQLEVGDASHQVGVAGALAVSVDRAL
jgi:hypothetical protein